MSWDPNVVGSVLITRDSPLETRRFGPTFSRAIVPLDLGESAFEDVLQFLREDEADVVVLRYPAARVDWFARLFAADRDLICADSLTYWSLKVGSGRRPEVDLSLTAAVAEAVDSQLIGGLVDDIFTGYGNHYLANPLLSSDNALAGYREWAQHSAAHDTVVSLTCRGEGIVGLATLESSAQTCEIQLAGIKSRYQKHGYYAHLLAGCENFAADIFASQLVISTQAHNANVQRAWARYGFEPVGTFLTVHAIRRGLLP